MMLQSNQLTQNKVLVRTIKEYPERPIKIEPSIFGNQPVASMDDLIYEVDRLKAAFPQMRSDFFGFVLKEAIRRGISKKRMEYIVNTIYETYPYPTITMQAIFDIDKYIHEVTPQEMYSLRIPHEPLAKIYFGGRYKIVYKKDAEAFGYPYEQFLSNAELKEKERLSDEERHRKEMEEYFKEHPEEKPSEESINIEELAKEFAL